MPEIPSPSRRGMLFGAAAVSAGALLTACTSNEPKKSEEATNNAPGRRRQARQGRHHRLRRTAGRPRLAERDQRERQVAGQEVLGRHPGDHRGLQRHGRPDRPGRDADQQEGRRPGHPPRRREGADPGRSAGHEGGHPRHQPGPDLRLPAGLPLLDRRRQLRHGPQRRQLHRRAAQEQAERQGHRARGARQPRTHQAAHQGLRRRAEELPQHPEGRPPGGRVHRRVGSGQDGPAAAGTEQVRRAVEPRRRPGCGRAARHRAGRPRRTS